jgi:hypothetical protein
VNINNSSAARSGGGLSFLTFFIQGSEPLVTEPENGTANQSGTIDSFIKPCDLLASGIQNPLATDATDDFPVAVTDVFNFSTHISP